MKNRILSIVLAVLTVMSVIPFTFLSASAEESKTPMPDTTYGFYYGKNGAKGTTGAEAIWVNADSRSYGLVGLDVKSGVEFDGHENLKSIKIGTDLQDGRIYYKNKDGAVVTSEKFGVNFCMYNNPENYRDEHGTIPLYGEQMYVAVQYYYDTTDRDETDEIGVDLTGKKMKWLQWGAGIGTDGAISNKLSLGAESEPIVANEWATAVFNLGTVPSEYVGGRMGQNKIYYQGDGYYQMKKGDVMYIGDTIIWSKDPTVESNYPTDTATVKLYANSLDYGQGYVMETAEPTYLTTYTLPEFSAEALPEDGTFLGWIDANDTDKLYQPGDEIFINRRKVEDFYAKIQAPVEVLFAVGDEEQYETWYSYTTVKLPAAPEAPEGEIFIGWRNDDDNELYAAGASYDFGEITSFVAEFGTPNEITFTYGESSFVEKWAPDTTVTLPAAPDYDPEDGTYFMGWKCSADDKVYAAGASYEYDGSDVSFSAYYTERPTVYYSKTAIDGVDSSITFDSLVKADAYIASMGGIGTIIVNGTMNIAGDGTTLLSSDLTIEGYDESAKASLDNTLRIAGTETNILFKDIIITMADRSADEQYIHFRNMTVEFDESCGFEQGPQNGTPKLNLYFGSENRGGTYGDQTIIFNSPAIKVSQLAPIAGWHAAGNFNLTQNNSYTFNAGTFSSAYLITRNGNNAGKASTVNGDTTFVINGGKFGVIALSHKPSYLNGTATIIINGGDFTKDVTIGTESPNAAAETSSVTNLVVVVNAKDVVASGTDVPKLLYGQKIDVTNTGISLLNNAELVSGDVNADYVAWQTPYRVAVYEGKADYKIVGDEVKLSLTADNAKATEVYVNDVLVEADAEGYYSVEKTSTLQKITFAIPGEQKYSVSYSDGNGTVVSDGEYYADTELLIKNMNFTNGKLAFGGYEFDGETYNIGDTFVMPAKEVTFVAKWHEPQAFVYYVSSEGSNTNDGKTAETAFATIDKAINTIGTEIGTIVVMDRVAWPSVEINGEITITGKDPASDTVYEAASLLRASGDARPTVSGSGSFTLSYIEDYNPGSKNNCPIQPTLPNFTIGEGYKFSVSGSANTVEISPKGSATDMVQNYAGTVRFVDFYNWSSVNYKGSVTINVLPTAKIGRDITLGGDTASDKDKASTCTVEGPVFVNFYNNQNAVKLVVGGYKRGSYNLFKGGVQVLSINSNNTISQHSLKDSTTVITGGEYYVTVNGALPEGANAVSSAMGKLTLTIPEGYEVIRDDANGSDKIAESGEVALAEGETTLAFIVKGDSVTVNFDDGSDSDSTFKGINYVVPGRDAKDGKVLLGWYYNDVLYFVGSTLAIPTDVDTVDLKGLWVSTPLTLYVDAENGDDTSMGLDASAPVKSFERVSAILSNITLDEATVKVIGTYGQTNSYNLPKFGGKIIIDGDGTATLTYGYDLVFNSDVEFRNIYLNCSEQWKQMTGNGYDITFGEGCTNAAGSQAITLHAGKINSNMTGDQTVRVESGTISVQAGPFYVVDGASMTWNGNFNLIVNGGAVSFVFGDGYSGRLGTFTMNGNVTILHNGGKITTTNMGRCTAVNGKILVVSKPEGGLTIGSITELGAVIAKLNGVDATVDGATITFNEDANLVNGANFTSGDTYELTENGIYNFRKGANVSAGLTVDGAQIRLDDPQALRFIAKYTAETEAAYAGCEYGFVVLPTKVLGNALLDAEATYTYDKKDYTPAIVPAAKLYDEKAGEYKRYTAAMTGFTADTYATEYTAVTYIKKDGAYIYGEQYSTSVYAIAKAALEDTTISAEAKTYFEGIVAAVEGAE